ncbi:MAG: glycosyl hydrolase family 18 protein [Clostridiales bacterium]|nr:glycosyl hydrolase family 18 protein [Clostridiales bacterium]
MRRTSRRHVKSRKTLPVRIVIGLICLIAIIGVAGEWINRRIPTKEAANLQELYGAEEGYIPVIANHQWIEQDALWENGHAYLEYEVIKNELNGRFYWDEEEKLLLYTFPEETVVCDAETEFDDAPVFLEKGEEVYISLSYVEKYSDIRVELFSDNLERIVLQTEWGEEEISSVKKNAAVRVKGGIKSPVITEVEAGEQVIILEEMDHWAKVQTADGWIGYMKKDQMEESETVDVQSDFEEPEYTNISVDYDICMVWQQVFDNSGEEQLKSLVKKKTSVTTMAPTWFSIDSEDGGFSSLASESYVKYAHKAGLDVWPVLENVNHGDVDMVQLLSRTSSRTKLIQNLMEELERSGADGLNVDLENLPEEAGDGFIQLVRELSVECRKRGLVLSVDNNVPSSWTDHYNRQEQGIVADYVVIMAYDEHYSGSEPGSTASLDFVQKGIVNTLKEVPAEKVINGVPFYTRLWKDDITSLTSEAMGMESAQAFVEKYQVEPEWQSDVGQNYVRVEDGDIIYQLWLEDEDSMESRLQMIDSYKLAGVSFWKLGMEDSGIWKTIGKFFE